MTRILVADDHPVVRQGIVRILVEKLGGPVCVGEARSGPEVKELLGRQGWDALVLDLSMPGGGGLGVLEEVKRRGLRTPVLVLSVHPEEVYAERVLRAGAAGYLTKESAPEELVNAVRRLLAGRRYVSASLAERLATTLRGGTAARPHDSLTDRELEVLRLLVGGRSVTEAARELGRSVKTVSTHRTRILRKMGMGSTVELARYALENGLVE